MDISGLLARKYDIQQQNADSQNRLSWAQAGLIGAQTQTEPMEAAARAVAARGTGAAGFGQAALANANAAQVPGLAGSEIGLRSAQGNELGSESWLHQIQGAPNANLDAGANYRFYGDAGAPPGTPGQRWDLGGNTGAASQTLSPMASQVPAYSAGGQPTGFRPLSHITFFGGEDPNVIGGAQKPGYDKGTSKVPGKGSSKVDSVPANLAPGEAVLNEAAAEHLGRSTIDFLNAIGAHKMGLTVGDNSGNNTQDKSSPTKAKAGDNPKVSQQTGDLPGYATGTPNVPGSSPSPHQFGDYSSPGDYVNSYAARGNVLPQDYDMTTPRQRGGGADQGTTPKPGYKAGTSKVPAKGKPSKAPKAPPGPTLPPPEIMQALMAMKGGGQGMPAPGGPPPMPMQMPQVARG